MSYFAAAICRAGPSVQKCILSKAIIPVGSYETRRGAKKTPRVAKTPEQRKAEQLKKSGKKPVERDENGQIIFKPKEKSIGAFRPLPAGSLTQPEFHSNNRAVLDLPFFSPKAIRQDMIGRAAEFALTDNDPIRKFGLPKKMLLEFRILSKPCSVIREVTIEAINMLKEAEEKSSLDNRVILTGRGGSGKSFLLLQAVEYCVAQNWIVIYLPRAVNLVNSSTPYAYDLRTQTYHQPVFAYQTLQRLLTVNSKALDALLTQKKLVLEKHDIPIGTPLSKLIEVALKETSPAISPLILDHLLKELEIQTTNPVLLAVDDFQAVYCKTAYRDPQFSAIRPYHLSMPRMIMEFASGRRSFAKGAILGAITYSDTNYLLPIELRDALGMEYDHHMSPYDKRSRTLLEYTKGLRALRVPEKLTLREATSLFEVWKNDNALTSNTYDELFLSKYTESGGNPREFVWKGILSTLES